MTSTPPEIKRPPTELVPHEFSPIRTDTPKPARSIRGPISLPGMVLLWFMPKRFGASLAAAGWTAALAAHLVGLAGGIGLIYWALFMPNWNPIHPIPFSVGPRSASFEVSYPEVAMTLSEYLRAPFTAFTTILHAATSASSGNRFGRVLTILLLGYSSTYLLAVAMMPFAAAGETKRALFARCLRLTRWATTLLIPIGVGVLAWSWFARYVPMAYPRQTLIHAAIAVFILWWMFVFLRSGLRYAGPAVGPAWEPHTPRCEGCGYIIANIPISTNCPECGRAVESSLPERRETPAYAQAADLAQARRAFDKTLRAAIFDTTFFHRLAVRRDASPDRKFFLTSAAITSLLPTLIAFCITAFHKGEMQVDVIATTLMIAAIAFASIVICTGLVATLAAMIGRRSARAAAIPTFYAMAGLLPLETGIALLFLAIPILALLLNETNAAVVLLLGVFGLACVVALGGYLTFIGLRCMVRAFRHTFPRTRRANA